MSIVVYYPAYDEHHKQVLASFYRGLRSHYENGEARWAPSVAYEPESAPDLAVIFGVGKVAVPRSADRQTIIDGQLSHGGDVLVLETGYVHRERYFAAGFNGLNGRADFCNEGSPPDRWEALEVDLQPRGPGKALLLCGQVPWDASVQHSNHMAWVENTASRLAEDWPGELLLAPHPKGPQYDMGGWQRINGPIEEKLALAHACVTFNSNCAVDALIAGVPAVTMDEGSMAWDVTPHSLRDLVDIELPPRYQWAADLAYTQWTLEEFASGEAWSHLSQRYIPSPQGAPA